MLETFLEAILWKPFQLVRLIPEVSSFQWWFKFREQVKIIRNQVRRVWGILQCCYTVLCREILDQNRPVCWSIVVKEKSTSGSPFLGAFPSDRIPKGTDDVKANFFIYNSNFFELYQRVSVNYASSEFGELFGTNTNMKASSNTTRWHIQRDHNLAVYRMWAEEFQMGIVLKQILQNRIDRLQ